VADDVARLDAGVYGVCCDDDVTLAAFRARLKLPYTLLSDPHLTCADWLAAPVSNRRSFYSAYALHAKDLARYPEKRFFQPALFVWRRDGSVAYEWRQRSKISNLYGATGRPSAAHVLAHVRDALATR
jgi:peroxiredoxin